MKPAALLLIASLTAPAIAPVAALAETADEVRLDHAGWDKSLNGSYGEQDLLAGDNDADQHPPLQIGDGMEDSRSLRMTATDGNQ